MTGEEYTRVSKMINLQRRLLYLQENERHFTDKEAYKKLKENIEQELNELKIEGAK